MTNYFHMFAIVSGLASLVALTTTRRLVCFLACALSMFSLGGMASSWYGLGAESVCVCTECPQVQPQTDPAPSGRR